MASLAHHTVMLSQDQHQPYGIAESNPCKTTVHNLVRHLRNDAAFAMPCLLCRSDHSSCLCRLLVHVCQVALAAAMTQDTSAIHRHVLSCDSTHDSPTKACTMSVMTQE